MRGPRRTTTTPASATRGRPADAARWAPTPRGGDRLRARRPGVVPALGLGALLLLGTLGGCRSAEAPGRPAPRPPGPSATAAWATTEAAIGSQARCTPSFPDTDGWSGGDAAWSLPRPGPGPDAGASPDQSVWLFGDSFVTRPDAPDRRRAYPFVHNSVGISTCTREGDFRFEPHWRRDEDGTPRAFFEPPATTRTPRPEETKARHDPVPDAPPSLTYYWPLDAFAWQGRLYVGLLRVAPGPPRGPFALPFRLLGVDLARIENPAEPPDAWHIRYAALVRGDLAFPGAAFVVARDRLHAFTFLEAEDGQAPRILTRLDLDALEPWPADLSGALETWTDDAGWQPGLDPKRGAVLMPDDATEMSVHLDPAAGEWLAVYAEPAAADPLGPDASDPTRGTVWLRRARRLEGPWSPREPLFRIPELAAPEPDPNLFCYAAKAHPQFAAAGSLLVTWVCNLFGRDEAEALAMLGRLAERGDLYRPRARRLPLPPAGARNPPARLAPAAPPR